MARRNPKAEQSANWTRRDLEHMAELCAQVMDDVAWAFDDIIGNDAASMTRQVLCEEVLARFVAKCRENCGGFKRDLFSQRVKELRDRG